jgi:hypothetical protein
MEGLDGVVHGVRMRPKGWQDVVRGGNEIGRVACSNIHRQQLITKGFSHFGHLVA